MNRVLFYRNVYDKEKKRNLDLTQDKLLFEKKCKARMDVEAEKIKVVNRLMSSKENLIEKLNQDIKNLSTANKNLLEEVTFYSNHVDFINKQKEIAQLELNYFKNELEIKKSNYKGLESKYKKLDSQYIAMCSTLKEYEKKVHSIYNKIYLDLLFRNNSFQLSSYQNR